MAHNFLQQFYPTLVSNTFEQMDKDNYQPLLRTIKNLKVMYPFAEERDANKVCLELISILAMEDWNEWVQRARGCAPDKLQDQIKMYKQLSEDYSLVGASSLGMPSFSIANFKIYFCHAHYFAGSNGSHCDEEGIG